MADHRRETPTQQAIRVLRPSVIARMPSAVLTNLLADLFVLVAQLVMMFIIGVPTWVLVAWTLSGLLAALFTHVRWTRHVEMDISNHRRTKVLLASHPGGAPLIAEVTAHCGCVHRWVWDPMRGESGRWVPAEIVESSDQCLVGAR